MKEIKLSIDDELYNRIEKICSKYGMDKNDLVESFIEEGFEELQTVITRMGQDSFICEGQSKNTTLTIVK